jgi:hypothetical protein
LQQQHRVLVGEGRSQEGQAAGERHGVTQLRHCLDDGVNIFRL